MEESLHLHEFFIEGGNPEKSQVILHITEPSTRDEQLKGIFFVLCELSGAIPDYTGEIEQAVERAKKIYYESLLSPENALEHALDSINKQSINLLKPYSTIEIAIGVLVNNTIVFAFYGSPNIILYYKNKEGRYLDLDLVKQNTIPATDEPEKTASIFNQIIQGKITPGDYIFIGSNGSLSVTKGEQLRQLITTRNPRESAMLIERGLRGLPTDRSFGGLIVSLAKPITIPQNTKYRTPTHGSAASLQHFFNTEQKTNETLSSSLGRHIGNKLQSKIDTLQQPASHPYLAEEIEETNYIPPRSRVRERNTHRRGKPSWNNTSHGILLGLGYAGQLGLRFLTFITNTCIGLIHTIGNIFVAITNYRGRRTLVIDGWLRTWRGYKEHFWQLPLLTKALFGVSLVLIIVFIISIFHIRSNQQRAAEQKAFDESIRFMNQQLDSAESALVYTNTTAALADISSAEVALLKGKAPCSQNTRVELCSAVKKRIDDLLLKARNITTVDAQIITGITAPLEISGLVKINTLLLAFSPNTSTIFTYNLLTKESGSVETTSTGFVAAAVPKENDYALFLANNGSLLSFNPKDKTFKQQLFSLPSSLLGHNITSLTIYNRRLYSLDAATGQLYRHDTIRGGFATGRDWIKDSSIETRGAVDVSIDGDIFILNPQGTIKKFTNGLAQNFTLQIIDPILTNARHISTYTDLTYLYLLDTTGKRLLIYDKTGKLYKQVMSPQFSTPSDMLVDEGNKTVYIIDTNKIYKIDLPI